MFEIHIQFGQKIKALRSFILLTLFQHSIHSHSIPARKEELQPFCPHYSSSPANRPYLPVIMICHTSRITAVQHKLSQMAMIATILDEMSRNNIPIQKHVPPRSPKHPPCFPRKQMKETEHLPYGGSIWVPTWAFTLTMLSLLLFSTVFYLFFSIKSERWWRINTYKFCTVLCFWWRCCWRKVRPVLLLSYWFS